MPSIKTLLAIAALFSPALTAPATVAAAPTQYCYDASIEVEDPNAYLEGSSSFSPAWEFLRYDENEDVNWKTCFLGEDVSGSKVPPTAYIYSTLGPCGLVPNSINMTCGADVSPAVFQIRTSFVVPTNSNGLWYVGLNDQGFTVQSLDDTVVQNSNNGQNLVLSMNAPVLSGIQ